MPCRSNGSVFVRLATRFARGFAHRGIDCSLRAGIGKRSFLKKRTKKLLILEVHRGSNARTNA
jgi:hypothetical protein